MASTLSRSEVDRFYASLSQRARIKLYAAIFFVLAPVGVFASSQFAASRTSSGTACPRASSWGW